MTPFFSIIIPVYNVAPYLRTCLDSVLAAEKALRQSDDGRVRELGVEVICIDDGSTDGSAAILRDYATISFGDLCEFVVVRQENQGQGVARNYGLDISRGKYVTFVDSDDTVVPWWLETLAGWVDDFKPDFIFYGYKFVFRQDELPERCVSRPAVCHLKTDGDAQVESVVRNVGSLYPWRCCIRKDAIGATRYVEIRPGEDVLFSTQLFTQVDLVIHTDTPLYSYFKRSGSTMNSGANLDFLLRAIRVTRMRHEALVSWRRYPAVRKSHLKEMRDCFAKMARGIGRLKPGEANTARRIFFDEGRRVFADGLCGFIFRWHLWRLFCLIYVTSWRARASLLKCSWVRAIRAVFRGRERK